jgi:hypothetical protein
MRSWIKVRLPDHDLGEICAIQAEAGKTDITVGEPMRVKKPGPHEPASAVFPFRQSSSTAQEFRASSNSFIHIIQNSVKV